MVKGVSRQVIVLHSPDREHFEQAIFILKEGQIAVSDEVLLKEAKRLLSGETKEITRLHKAVWAVCGGAITSLIWVLGILL